MSKLLPGVFPARHKDDSIYYRASMTCRSRHISLGSFDTEIKAHRCYTEARRIIDDPASTIEKYDPEMAIGFDKYVILCNLRDNDVYISRPIYVRPKLFYYYFAPGDFYIFSREDLFYYSAHSIQRRGGHLFVADYGSQLNILSRYGIRSHAVAGIDYLFKNGNPQDMQYSNIEIINPYHGVRKKKDRYETRIHINGYTRVGIYDTAIEAAIAYNKAADILRSNGAEREYATNYIDGLPAKSYAQIYTDVEISKAFT